MIHLPISGLEARWRPATGHEDITLAESHPGLAGAVAYASSGVEGADGTPLDCAGLPIGDLDLLIVSRRREILGDAFVAEGSCLGCSAHIDVHFGLADFASHHRPRATRAVVPTPEPGWWRLRAIEVTFRLPVAADILAVAGRAGARLLLEQRCVRGGHDARARRLTSRAMSILGPALRAEVAGVCPECSADVLLDVDARELCLAELRFLANSVLDDVHVIAAAYGWPEAAILGLPSSRRTRYAGLIGGRTAGLEFRHEEVPVA
jgi:hypothetical protein